MSDERNSPGELSTTTVSSVAIQAGNSRIVVAILKCGALVELQLAEAIPNLLEIGSNQDETKKLLQDHEMLLGKLKSLEDNVWDLLCEADKTAEENPEQSQVYDAMAVTLKDAWEALISALENRQALLKMALAFFQMVLEFAATLNQAEGFLHSSLAQDSVDSVKELLHQHQSHTKGLLERSLAVLNKSHELTEFIEQFKMNQSIANSDMIRQARNSCRKIEDLLESLQDRRRQLDKQLKQKRGRLEKVLQVIQWHQQEDKVTCWLKKHIDLYLKNGQLGASLTENEELIHKHSQLAHDAKKWTLAIDKLKSEACGIVALEGCEENGTAEDLNEKLKKLHAEFWEQMDQRLEVLQEANAFFKSVNKAFDKLGSIETYLKQRKDQDLNLPQLAEKQREAEAEIRDCTTDPFQKGKALLSKSFNGSGMSGIQEMIRYLQKRVDQLMVQILAPNDQALKEQQNAVSLEEHFRKVSLWVQRITADLERYNELGWSLAECEEVLSKLIELANQTKEASQYMESAGKTMSEVAQSVPLCTEEFSNRTHILEEQLKDLDQSIDEKLECLNGYIAFLKSSAELKSAIQSLRKLYTSNMEEGAETDTASVLKSAEGQLQFVLTQIFSVQDMGQNCLNIIKMMNTNTVLNNKHAQAIERTIDNLNKEKAEIINLGSIWQQRLNQANSTNQQWRTIKDKLQSATDGLEALEKDLQPFYTLSLGNNFQTILNAQEKLNHIKNKYQNLNADAEYAIKISDLLAREGTQLPEKSGKINYLAELHQKVRDSIAEYDDIFIKMVAFYQVKTELEFLVKAEQKLQPDHELQLNQMQDQQTHFQTLYKLVVNLGREIISTIQHSKHITIPVMELQEQIAKIEPDSTCWNSTVEKQEEKLLSHLEFGTTIEDINELKESFKDLKKKFNNLKFNYTKKAEKGRNLKVIKNQIQQVEMYAERMQVLKKKVDNLGKKMPVAAVTQQADRADAVKDAMGGLQKQVHDFGIVIEEYKQNLEMAEDLHHIIEECQFWCEEACATVVRVGRYSAECKTKESVEMLLKQFNKFVQPTLPQQEERMEQMTRIAKLVYGPDDGMKYIEKMTVKHKEALHSVNELCIYLKELEEKLEEPRKLAPVLLADATEESILNPSAELPTSAKAGSTLTDMDLHPELLAEDTASGDEYECISPDDISLPPLAETPESNLPQSETELEEQNCFSSHSLHVTSYSLQMQINATGKKMVDRSELLTPVANNDAINCKKEKTSNCSEIFSSPSIGYKVESPFAHQPAIVHEMRYSLNSPPAKASPSHSMMNEMHETHWQHHSVYESTKKKQQLHVTSNSTKTKDRLHATPDDFSSVMFQSDPAKSCQSHVTAQDAIKSHASLVGQTPGFSTHLPNVTVKEGSPVTLEVEVTGYPEPAVTWWVAYNEEQ
ncbi:hypothetical protein XELAEV_18044765mg [Xenopus laevis]|uniref:Ig-like domain-containing protein n=1 Tax=Xenopus laevis TaxID=8355 RepID=A0A974BZM7_XENLA|nr:hypothetical protein XELAEV_18044765mg [Xenopus laevis]